MTSTSSFRFHTVDVFTQQRFGGNPLATVLDADALDGATMQSIAAEFNLSETAFVVAPTNPANTSRVRIFNRTSEMRFAGHPMVGTAFVLAGRLPDLSEAVFEVPAGLVRASIDRNADGAVTDVTIAAPQRLTLGQALPPELLARVLGLDERDILTLAHPPVIASNGNPYVIAEVTREALGRCSPNIAAFEAARSAYAQEGDRFSVHAYSRAGGTLSARMFAPLSGTSEDPATGSANAPLACLLLSLEPAGEEISFEVHQGVEMGRPSVLHVEARRSRDGIEATVRGSCVPVMRGEITL